MNGNRDKRRATLELTIRLPAGTLIVELDGPDEPEGRPIARRSPKDVARGVSLEFSKWPTEGEGSTT